MAENNIIALDVGEKRIGVARAHADIGFASPLTTLANDSEVWAKLETILLENQVSVVVVGLPRNLRGEDTAQTVYCRTFADQVENRFGLSIVMQDEALTSQKAETELKNRKKNFQKSDVDALAATFILEDYLSSGIIKT